MSKTGCKSVCVVGAGLSGLAAVRGLTQAGHEVTCFDAGSAIGGSWRYENDNGVAATYASLHTNVSRRSMQYPSMPHRERDGERLHHAELLAYLETYARVNNLLPHIELGTHVSQARPQDDGGWLVELEGASSRSFDALVVATGIFCHPQMPDLPGEFEGEIVHVRDYRTPDAFAGRRVLVLGAGQSALDAAAEISFLAERTLIACREGHHLLPPRAFGRAFDHLDLASLNRLPWPVVRSGFQALLRLSGATPARGELPVPNHPILEHRWPALATPNIERALAERTFAVRPAPASIEGEHVTFADGRGEAFDTIVCATGYRVDFPFLPERLGRGEGIQFPLYRRTLSPHNDTLAFIGVHDAGAGRMELVERQVQWLAAVLSGRIALPSHAKRWAAINACGEPRTRRRFGSSGAHTFLCDRYAYLRTLKRDLRAAT